MREQQRLTNDKKGSNYAKNKDQTTPLNNSQRKNQNMQPKLLKERRRFNIKICENDPKVKNTIFVFAPGFITLAFVNKIKFEFNWKLCQ
jgi:hypothetical protein